MGKFAAWKTTFPSTWSMVPFDLTMSRRLVSKIPAATADHITKNIPTAILFREEGSRPRRFRNGSTTLSLRGMSMRMSTASNMVSQAAGKVNFVRKNQRRRDEIKMYTKQQSMKTKQTVCTQTQLTLFVYICVCIQNKQARFSLDTALAPPGGQN